MLPGEQLKERVVDQLSQSITGKTWIAWMKIRSKRGLDGLEQLKPHAPAQKQS